MLHLVYRIQMMVRTFDVLSKKSGSVFCVLHRTNRDFMSGRDCRLLDVLHISHYNLYKRRCQLWLNGIYLLFLGLNQIIYRKFVSLLALLRLQHFPCWKKINKLLQAAEKLHNNVQWVSSITGSLSMTLTGKIKAHFFLYCWKVENKM